MTSHTNSTGFQLSCPFPIQDYPQVVLAHGGGGKLTHDLIEKLFLRAFGNPIADELMDGAIIKGLEGSLVMATDSHVVSPIFFPGGDIGSLSVYGTTNDVAMCGAKPLYLSVAFILEEGFPMESLWKIAQSMQFAADKTGVKIVTGDTKVVEKGKGDGVYINTTGLGVRMGSLEVGTSRINPGDAIVISGDIGRHGISIMASREGIEFETDLISDCGPLSPMVEKLFQSGIEIHCMRDLTRGGLATALVELSKQSQREFILEETNIPVLPAVRSACELLGLDPLYVANEGCFALFCPPDQVEETVSILHSFANGRNSCQIGQVTASEDSGVSLHTSIGTPRYLTLLSGEQLPRIC